MKNIFINNMKIHGFWFHFMISFSDIRRPDMAVFVNIKNVDLFQIQAIFKGGSSISVSFWIMVGLMIIKARFSKIILSLLTLFILITMACDRVSPFQNKIRGGLGVTGKPMIVNSLAYANLTDRRVVFNDNGVGLAVVSKNSGSTSYTCYSLYYSVFSPSSGTWSEEALLQVVGSYSNFALASDGENFMLVFIYNSGLFSRTYANGAWSTVDMLPMVNSYLYCDDLMLFGSPTGYLAVYRDNSYYYYYACVFEGSSWGDCTQLAYASSVFTESMIASNGAGGYCFAWIYNYTVNAVIYDPAAEWGTLPVTPTILSDSLTSCQGLALVSDGAGYCAAWEEFSSTGIDNDVMASIYDDASGTWIAKTAMDNTDAAWDANAYSPALATNGSSYGVAWIQNDASNDRVVARGCSGTTWDTDCEVLSDAGAPVWNARGASNGDTYAVGYIQYDSALNLDKPFVRILDPGSGLGWGAAQRLSNDSLGNDSYLALRSDGTGYLAAWRQQEATADRLFASEFDGSAWGTPVTADAGSYPAEIPKLRSYDGGYYFQWTEDNDQGNTCNVNALLPSGWTGARDVASDNDDDSSCLTNKIAAATADSGAFMVAYLQHDNGVAKVFGRINNGAWGDPFVIADDFSDYYSIELMIATDGTDFMAVISYYSSSDYYYHLYTRTYTAAGLETDTGDLLPTGTTNPPYRISMVSNGSGYCIAWIQASYDVYASVYNGASWTTSGPIDGTSYYVSNLSLATDGAGYCIAWTEQNASYYYDACASVYDGTGWSAAVNLDDNPTTNNYDANSLVLASNGSGYCAAWSQYDYDTAYHYDININRYESGTWLGTESVAAFSSSPNSIQVAASGADYCVSWYRSMGSTYGIYSCLHDDTSGSWGEPVILNDLISSMNTSLSYFYLVPSGGDFSVAWSRQDGATFTYNLVAAASEDGQWGESEIINAEVPGSSSDFYIQPGDSGYFIAWMGLYGGTYNLIGTAYEGGFGSKCILDSEPGIIDNNYLIVPSGAGYRAFWFQKDSENSTIYNLWTNRIVP